MSLSSNFKRTDLSKYAFWLCSFVMIIVGSVNISTHDVQEWDESRNGVNAFEMIKQNDYLNYYYNGNLDTWNAKPPLLNWLIVLSYRAFGNNEFALRLPILISTVIFFILCYRIIRLEESETFALFSVGILFCCKAVLGNHAGLSGDFDMLLTTLLTASLFHFLKFIIYRKGIDLMWSFFWISIAFYVKGPAAFVYLPGFLLCVLFMGRFRDTIFRSHFLIGILMITVAITTWIYIAICLRKDSHNDFYGSRNSIETLFIHDPFIDHAEGAKVNRSVFFLFNAIDVRYNVWNYIFYLSLASGIFILIRERGKINQYLKEKWFVVSIILIPLPYCLVLTFGSNQHDWYILPLLLFIIYLTSKGVVFLCRKWTPYRYLATGVFVFTFFREIIYLSTQSKALHNFFGRNELSDCQNINILKPVGQNYMLYYDWRGIDLKEIQLIDAKKHQGECIFYNKEENSPTLGDEITALSSVDGYILGVIK
jgi:4-amino-4-deoxy-L-arabinose transferase-like glycosyltransferase